MIEMIEEEFLPYEIVVPLVIAEFPYQNILLWKDEPSDYNRLAEKCYPLITINQALTWIRLRHYYNIVITEVYVGRYVWGYTLHNLVTHEEEYFSSGYSSWEEAALRGIEKLLKEEKL
jgi:hypothetical protein